MQWPSGEMVFLEKLDCAVALPQTCRTDEVMLFLDVLYKDYSSCLHSLFLVN